MIVVFGTGFAISYVAVNFPKTASISPKCPRLIEAMQCYHYPDSTSVKAASENPVKDGVYDHPIDALRYFFAGYTHNWKISNRQY